jgi:hypothetical protein
MNALPSSSRSPRVRARIRIEDSSGYFNSVLLGPQTFAQDGRPSTVMNIRPERGVILFLREHLARKSHRDVPRCAESNQLAGSQTDRATKGVLSLLPFAPTTSSDMDVRRSHVTRIGIKKSLGPLNSGENDPAGRSRKKPRREFQLVTSRRASCIALAIRTLPCERIVAPSGQSNGIDPIFLARGY